MKTSNIPYPLVTPLQLAFHWPQSPRFVVAGLLISCLVLAGAICARAQSTYTPYAFTTLAGSPGHHGSADGTNDTALFFDPTSVAVDSAGNVYVADTHQSLIRKVTPDGVVTTLAGGTAGSADGTNDTAQFGGPTGVAVDSAGNVYVADHGNHTIRKVTPEGVVTTLAGLAGYSGSADGTNSTARFYYPSGVAVDDVGNVYVADTENFTIRKVTPAGVVTTVAGLAHSSGSADGTGSDARFNYPKDVAVDSGGNVYVADYYNDTIRKIAPGNVVTTLAGLAGNIGSTDGTGNAARFHYPSGVAVDSFGNVYVADANNHTIRRATPDGEVTTLAGKAGGAGGADGTGSAARFYYPSGVALDSVGNVYVADHDNYTIRKGSVVFSLVGVGFTSQRIRFTLTGPAGSNAIISASTDLMTWVPLLTNFLTGGSLNFTDTLATNYPIRFYRAYLE